MTADPHAEPELHCRDLVEVVTAYLDGVLGEADRRRLEAHLRECEDCVAYVEQIRTTIAGTERSGDRVPPLAPNLREGMRRAFRGWAG